MSALDALLESLPARVLVCGKGGVGKTTCAAALATRAAARQSGGERTLLLSTDPARSLGDALGVQLHDSPAALPAPERLFAMQLDPAAVHSRFLSRWRDVLVTLFDRGTYLSTDESAAFVDAAIPGIDETMALLTLLDLEDEGWARLVVDTAPTGHTLRLLELPESFAAVLALLDAMQEKHRFMVRALTHRYRVDDVDRFLESMRSRLTSFRAALADPDRFAVVLVARAESLVVDESARYASALAMLGLAPRAIVVNAVPSGELDADTAAAMDALDRVSPGVARFSVPLLDGAPVGLSGIERWGELMGRGVRSARSTAPSPPDEARAPWAPRRGHAAPPKSDPRMFDTPVAPGTEPALGRRVELPHVAPLTIVAGKGGVGKTSVACALGVAMADRGQSTLVVSTDPAPSIADALAQSIGDDLVAVEGADGLFAQQLDASAAFARFRDRYRERVDALFDTLLRGAMDAAHDRLVVRELLSLAPPGIDELYALAALGERLAEGRFDTIIVDPAPTGHLLRLLELPALALEWSHRLLRLMLDYREVVPLGQAAEEMLGFARRTRALDALLHDDERATVLLVAMDEPLVRDESVRLVEGIRALDMSVGGVLWNRLAGWGAEPLPMGRALAQFESAVMVPAPRGVAALRAWSAAWRRMQIGAHG